MLVVDGSFEEQIDELAQYIDSIAEGESKLQEQIEACLQKDDKEAAIKAAVDAGSAINNAAEKDFEPSYNLLLYILLQADEPQTLLPTLLSSLTQARSHSVVQVYKILWTVFNVVPQPAKLDAFKALLQFSQAQGLQDTLLPKVAKQVGGWLSEWSASPQQAKEIYQLLGALASKQQPEATPNKADFLVKACEQQAEADEALATETVVACLNEPSRLMLNDVLVLPPVRQLKGEPLYALLSLLTTGNCAEYKQFLQENKSLLSQYELNAEVLESKFKLLTLASLAAAQNNRKLRYADIASALDIAESEVEVWVIDAIRAGVVEGKLSQTSETFLVHRATMRVFEHEQWEEVSAKLASWRESLQGIMELVDNVQAENGETQVPVANNFEPEEEEVAAEDATEEAERSEVASVGSMDENAD
ncbi:hypothetical protein BCR37DRAFT_398481, partial [Protomyces lactucae-debilis]